MTLDVRLNRIISEQHISKREFAKRVGISENYLYILTGNSRQGTSKNKTIGLEFGYDPQWILNGDSE